MIKKAIILCIAIMLAEVFVGCMNDDDCNSQNYRLNLIGIKSEIVQLTENTICPTTDTSKCYLSLTKISQKDSAIIKQKEFGITIDYQGTQKTAYRSPSIFLTQLYACVPSQYIGLTVPITKLEVRCSHEILNTKAGELIDYPKLEFRDEKEIISVDEWIKKVNKNYISYFHLVIKEPIISDDVRALSSTITKFENNSQAKSKI